jgi:hypothetical protein
LTQGESNASFLPKTLNQWLLAAIPLSLLAWL